MQNDVKQLARQLPAFPPTPHIPYHPNLAPGDTVAPEMELNPIFFSPNVIIEEKIDGASAAIMLDEDGHAIIRNKDHVLQKGYLKDTPAKLQFRSLWNYVYDHRTRLERLNEIFQYPVGVYGEWCLALHGVAYDRLPEYFIAWGLYSPYSKQFVAQAQARTLLKSVGFVLPPMLWQGAIESYAQLAELCQGRAAWGSPDEQREGVYVKISNEHFLTHRFKMVRPDFKQGCKWSEDQITKQALQF